MPFDLDNIMTEVDCPKCRAMISVPYRQMRIQKAAGCACGALITLIDETPIAKIQRLIDETNPRTSAND